jgi:hypothetical protein
MASADDRLIDELTKTLRDAGATVRAIELQRVHHHYDKEAGQWCYELVLSAVLEAPGWTDSRYRALDLTTLPAGGANDKARAETLAVALAERMGVESSCFERPRWIERQPQPAPEVDYDVAWEAVVRLDDGSDETRSGTERMRARSGKDAGSDVAKLVGVRLDSGRRPVCTRVFIPELGQDAATPGFQSRPYPAGVAGIEIVRGWRRDGRTVAQILTAIRDDAPSLPPLSFMLVLQEAFELPRRAVDDVLPWCRGELTDDALNHALEPRIETMRDRWNRPFTLREARAKDASIAALLRTDKKRGEPTIQLILSVREAFPGLSLGVATTFVCSVGDEPDETLDTRLNASILESEWR